MKKLFYLLATVAVVAFVGCSKEDDGELAPGQLARTPENIAGTWKAYKEFFEDNDGSGWIPLTDQHTFTFDKNGSFSWTEYGEYGTDILTGYYKITGNNLDLDFTGIEDDYKHTIESLTESELVIIWEVIGDEEHEKDHYYYQRVK